MSKLRWERGPSRGCPRNCKHPLDRHSHCATAREGVIRKPWGPGPNGASQETCLEAISTFNRAG